MILKRKYLIIKLMSKYSFGKFLKEKRMLFNLSLNKFSVIADVDSAIISRIENGKQDVKLNVLCKIAKAFNLSASELLAEFENK